MLGGVVLLDCFFNSLMMSISFCFGGYSEFLSDRKMEEKAKRLTLTIALKGS